MVFTLLFFSINIEGEWWHKLHHKAICTNPNLATKLDLGDTGAGDIIFYESKQHSLEFKVFNTLQQTHFIFQHHNKYLHTNTFIAHVKNQSMSQKVATISKTCIEKLYWITLKISDLELLSTRASCANFLHG